MTTIAEIYEAPAYGPAPESAERAEAWLDGHARRMRLYIDGDFVEPREAEYFTSTNPATAQPLAEIAQSGAADIDAAVAAARAAQPAWHGLGGHGRARFLYALARLVQKHARLLAVLETLDNGKPIRETRDIDIPLAARHFYHHAGWAQLAETEFPGHEPVGVAGQIIPWNFPLLMLAWKLAPALAAGCTAVLKPAEFTSLTALLFAELCRRAGLPAGVVNIVTGDGRAGELIVDHDGVDKIAFTGSTEVGRRIRAATAGSGKELTLELGGKSPFIVFDDADLDSAVEGVVDAIWFNQGQVCCAGSRLLLHEGIAAAMVEKLKRRMEKLRVGDPLDKAVDIGAIGRPGAARAQSKGWSRAASRKARPCGSRAGRARATAISIRRPFSPTSSRPRPWPTRRSSARCWRRWPSAPPPTPSRSPTTTRYGLAASVWSENIGLALDIAPQIKSGVVWINATNLFDAACGFGGYRESGFGREGGAEGMWAYLRPRALAPPSPAADDEAAAAPTARAPAAAAVGAIDRTAKMYVGGRQVRPDSGYSRPVTDPGGRLVGEVGDGNRKDIRDAVEAARGAAGWTRASAHQRAQIIYYLAENLDARGGEFRYRLIAAAGLSKRAAAKEVDAAVRRLFTYAAWADKHDGCGPCARRCGASPWR